MFPSAPSTQTRVRSAWSDRTEQSGLPERKCICLEEGGCDLFSNLRICFFPAQRWSRTHTEILPLFVVRLNKAYFHILQRVTTTIPSQYNVHAPSRPKHSYSCLQSYTVFLTFAGEQGWIPALISKYAYSNKPLVTLVHVVGLREISIYSKTATAGCPTQEGTAWTRAANSCNLDSHH